jgi:hypothetical protein
MVFKRHVHRVSKQITVDRTELQAMVEMPKRRDEFTERAALSTDESQGLGSNHCVNKGQEEGLKSDAIVGTYQ